MPSQRKISQAIRANVELPDTVSAGPVGQLLRGNKVPGWRKLEVIVRQLIHFTGNRKDFDTVVARFRQLWLAI